VDEVPANLEQCAFLARVFETGSVRPVLRSAYGLAAEIEPRSLDLIVFSGVLYHLSDMLVGLFALRELLRPGGTLVLQSNALDDFDRSYANFGRFVAGRWWQPTARCVLDMLELMGFADAEARMYGPEALLARATATSDELRFKRGLNWAFDDLRDREQRSLDATLMAPARPG